MVSIAPTFSTPYQSRYVAWVLSHRILFITPTNLCKQWHQKLQDKFGLKALVVEAKSNQELVKGGSKQPFEQAGLELICSYQFARTKAGDLRSPALNALPAGQMQRIPRVLWKLLAFSSYAVGGALGAMAQRMTGPFAADYFCGDGA